MIDQSSIVRLAFSRYAASVAPLLNVKSKYFLDTKDGAWLAIADAFDEAARLLTPARALGAVGEAEEALELVDDGAIVYGVVGLGDAEAPDLVVVSGDKVSFVEVKKKNVM
ncbi:MAG: hypothetical protein IMX05_01390 [Hydrogenibacillus schlegelii]|nr:hypothetical protein [Hydrogenibacillus schlegelii]